MLSDVCITCHAKCGTLYTVYMQSLACYMHVTCCHVVCGMLRAGGGSKDARDMRNMEMERRLREGEDVAESWTQLGGFEKYTKVSLRQVVVLLATGHKNTRVRVVDVIVVCRIYCYSHCCIN